jgi:3-oxoacyl-[acyl-carrier protein] reductase
MAGNIGTSLSGQLALVTGAGRGIGLGIALELAAAGARLAINDLDSGAAREAVRLIGGNAFSVPGDVSDQTSAASIIAEVETIGSLNILVNNAGVPEKLSSLRNQDLEDWQHVMDVNLRSVYLMSRAAAGFMIPRGAGVIINIASVAGINTFSASHAYGVSKAAVVMLTKTLACELARYQIRVNGVAPGVIRSPMLDGITEERKGMSSILARVPLGRLGTPQEVGATVAFLCSSAAAYITGVVLPVDGGWVAFGGYGDASVDKDSAAAPSRNARS